MSSSIYVKEIFELDKDEDMEMIPTVHEEKLGHTKSSLRTWKRMLRSSGKIPTDNSFSLGATTKKTRR